MGTRREVGFVVMLIAFGFVIFEQRSRRRKFTHRSAQVLVSLVHGKINIPTTQELVEDYFGQVGAVVTFEGITRNTFEGKTVIALEYEAYEPMALSVMIKLAKTALVKFDGLKKVVILHRLGLCPTGEISLFVATMSPHRESAILAIPYIVDELKRMVPIWKLENYSREDPAWKENPAWNPRSLAVENESDQGKETTTKCFDPVSIL